MKSFLTLTSFAIISFGGSFALAQQEAELNTEGKIEAAMPALRPFKEVVLVVLDNQRKELATLNEKASAESLKKDIAEIEKMLTDLRAHTLKLDNEADRPELNQIAKFLTNEISRFIDRVEELVAQGT